MDASPRARLSDWLAGEATRALGPSTVERLRAGASVRVGRHGTTVGFLPHDRGARRVCAFDRRGTLLTALRWRADGALDEAWVRISDGTWLAIEPRAVADAPWGVSDRLWHAPVVRASDDWRGTATPLTVFAAVDWTRPAVVPPLAEPARVPPGGGTAVLNLLAELAADGDVPDLPYRGPYPSEQLFLALLECFRYRTAAPDPLAAFVAGDLTWAPAPHERLFLGTAYVQLRGRVEKVVAEGRTYVRPDWQTVMRHAPRRLRDSDDGVRCSLWALDAALEDHFRVGRDGEPVERLDTGAPPTRTVAMPPAVAAGVGAVLAAGSAPALGPASRAAAAESAVEWGPVERDLVVIGPRRARVSTRLLDAFARRLAIATSAEARLGLGLATLVEIAQLLGDALRARAARALAELPPMAQAAAVAGSGTEARAGADARAITDAVEALLGAAS